MVEAADIGNMEGTASQEILPRHDSGAKWWTSWSPVNELWTQLTAQARNISVTTPSIPTTSQDPDSALMPAEASSESLRLDDSLLWSICWLYAEEDQPSQPVSIYHVVDVPHNEGQAAVGPPIVDQLEEILEGLKQEMLSGGNGPIKDVSASLLLLVRPAQLAFVHAIPGGFPTKGPQMQDAWVAIKSTGFSPPVTAIHDWSLSWSDCVFGHVPRSQLILSAGWDVIGSAPDYIGRADDIGLGGWAQYSASLDNYLQSLTAEDGWFVKCSLALAAFVGWRHGNRIVKPGEIGVGPFTILRWHDAYVPALLVSHTRLGHDLPQCRYSTAAYYTVCRFNEFVDFLSDAMSGEVANELWAAGVGGQPNPSSTLLSLLVELLYRLCKCPCPADHSVLLRYVLGCSAWYYLCRRYVGPETLHWLEVRHGRMPTILYRCAAVQWSSGWTVPRGANLTEPDLRSLEKDVLGVLGLEDAPAINRRSNGPSRLSVQSDKLLQTIGNRSYPITVIAQHATQINTHWRLDAWTAGELTLDITELGLGLLLRANGFWRRLAGVLEYEIAKSKVFSP